MVAMSTCSFTAVVTWSMTIACTSGSSTSGPKVETNWSGSTSSTRAHAPTTDTGTRIDAITMQRAETKARHPFRFLEHGLGAATSGSMGAVSASDASRSFSASRAAIRALRAAASSLDEAVAGEVMSP